MDNEVMSNEENYAFDVAGYLHIPGVLTQEEVATLNEALYQINGIRIVFPFCKSTENRHVPAPSFCFWKTIDTF